MMSSSVTNMDVEVENEVEMVEKHSINVDSEEQAREKKNNRKRGSVRERNSSLKLQQQKYVLTHGIRPGGRHLYSSATYAGRHKIPMQCLRMPMRFRCFPPQKFGFFNEAAPSVHPGHPGSERIAEAHLRESTEAAFENGRSDINIFLHLFLLIIDIILEMRMSYGTEWNPTLAFFLSHKEKIILETGTESDSEQKLSRLMPILNRDGSKLCNKPFPEVGNINSPVMSDKQVGMNELFAEMIRKKLDMIQSPIRLNRLHTEIMNILQQAIAEEINKPRISEMDKNDGL
ncbi:unnamed protein product [Thelazia callipaeda]|uniref:Ty3-gypsy retrotransposon protein n=1 Tax=Thelazia callipaeda TaxID=103827 RepID=A0A0N5CKV8_THECL|nr:unnamed protein product [Thelazia callipaeda]